MSKISAAMSRIVNRAALPAAKLGHTLTYNVLDGASTDIAYIDGEIGEREIDEIDGTYRLRERAVYVAIGNAVDVVDTVTISGEDWAIKQFSSDDVALIKIDIERRELIKKLRR